MLLSLHERPLDNMMEAEPNNHVHADGHSQNCENYTDNSRSHVIRISLECELLSTNLKSQMRGIIKINKLAKAKVPRLLCLAPSPEMFGKFIRGPMGTFKEVVVLGARSPPVLSLSK